MTMTGDTPRVLVVDDDPDVRAVIAMQLSSEGYEVRAEADVSAGTDAVKVFHPHVVVLDVMFSGAPDGLSLARRLRADEGVPVVLVSADGSPRLRLEGFAAGADDYVTKPF